MDEMNTESAECRARLLAAISKHAALPHDGMASMVRNWATAYGILTDKELAVDARKRGKA